MEIFELMHRTNNNELVFFEEPSVGLRAVIAINDLTLGPAIATCRMQEYGTINKGVNTALLAALYNTYRSALLHKPFGGAGLALCGNPNEVKNEMYFRALGIFINKLNGKFYLVRSSSITREDMMDIQRESKYLLGINENYILKGYSPVISIVKGMMKGLEAIVRKKLGKEGLSDMRFVVQGVGEVGSAFVKELLKIENIKIIITDTVYDKIKDIQDIQPDIKVVKPDEIYKQKCDIFVSCADNHIIDEEAAKQLNCKILTGSTNEMLKNESIEDILEEKKIFYIPGFIVNGGEIIYLDNEFHNKPPEILEAQFNQIATLVNDLIEKSEETNQRISTLAIETAKNYIQNVALIKKLK